MKKKLLFYLLPLKIYLRKYRLKRNIPEYSIFRNVIHDTINKWQSCVVSITHESICINENSTNDTWRILIIAWNSLYSTSTKRTRSDRRDLASRSRAKGEPSPLILGPNRTDSLWYKIKGWHASTAGEPSQAEGEAEARGRFARVTEKDVEDRQGRVASPPRWGMTERVG